jgi:hypothetical protein
LSVRITAPRTQAATITVFDIQGRVLFNNSSTLFAGLNWMPVDTKRFTAGVYTIIIRSEGQKLVRKIIKL